MTIMMPAPDQPVGRRDASVKALPATGGNSKCGASRLTPNLLLRLKITLGNILHGRLVTWIPTTHYIHSSKTDPKGYNMNLFRKRDHTKMSLMASLLLGAGLCTLGNHQAAATEPQLEQAIQDGKALFVHETFGGAGNTCQTCHVEGGAGPGKSGKGDAIPSLANAATIYPRFNPKANKVETLEDKIGHCIAGALRGKPPAYGSEQMTQLVSYITSLAQGKPLDMGGKPQ